MTQNPETLILSPVVEINRNPRSIFNQFVKSISVRDSVDYFQYFAGSLNNHEKSQSSKSHPKKFARQRMNTFSHCQYYTINGKNLNIHRLHPFLDFVQKSQMRLRRMKAQESLNRTSSPGTISTLTYLHPRSRIPASFQKFQISIFIGKMEIGDRIFYINEFLI